MTEKCQKGEWNTVVGLVVYIFVVKYDNEPKHIAKLWHKHLKTLSACYHESKMGNYVYNTLTDSNSYLISTDLRSKLTNNDNNMPTRYSLTFTFNNTDVM